MNTCERKQVTLLANLTSEASVLVDPQPVLLWGNVSHAAIAYGCKALASGTAKQTVTVNNDNWLGGQPYTTTFKVSCRYFCRPFHSHPRIVN